MTKKVLPGLIATALAGIASFWNWKAYRNRRARDAARSRGWREQLAEILEADITNLDSVIHGFNRPARRRDAAPPKRPRVSPR
jgi:hypothetical protein